VGGGDSAAAAARFRLYCVLLYLCKMELIQIQNRKSGSGGKIACCVGITYTTRDD
jgi:hypothetical protein